MRSEQETGFLAFILFCLSIVYAGIMKIRALLYQWGILKINQLPCNVISIGNISIGGTGKTPMTIYLARLLKQSGYHVVIISRGYKGSYEQPCAVVSDGTTIFMDARSAGDEPFLMAQKLSNIPIIVGKKRHECGLMAIQKFYPDIILLDDAFQHLSIFRDINILLMDHLNPLGNKHVIPRGILREPKSHIHRAHLIVLTRAPQASDDPLSQIKPYVENKPIFKCCHVPDQLMQSNDSGAITFLPSETFSNQPVYAFSGIANNNDFLQMLEKLKYQVVGFISFNDHHDYKDADLKTIETDAKNAGARYLLTTEKDFVKISSQIPWSFPLFALGVQLSFGNDSKRFHSTIQARVTKK